jgi:hypothetical protein
MHTDRRRGDGDSPAVRMGADPDGVRVPWRHQRRHDGGGNRRAGDTQPAYENER